jgi:hypothetical protein
MVQLGWCIKNTLKSHCHQHQEISFNIAECDDCMNCWVVWQTEQLDKKHAKEEKDREENRRYKPRLNGRGRSSYGTQ